MQHVGGQDWLELESVEVNLDTYKVCYLFWLTLFKKFQFLLNQIS